MPPKFERSAGRTARKEADPAPTPVPEKRGGAHLRLVKGAPEPAVEKPEASRPTRRTKARALGILRDNDPRNIVPRRKSIIDLATQNRRRDRKATPEARKAKKSIARSIPGAVFSATMIGATGAIPVDAHIQEQAAAEAAAQAREAQRVVETSELHALETISIDETTTFLAGDLVNSPFAQLLRQRGTIQVSNLYLQLPGHGLYDMVTLRPDTLIVVTPGSIVARWWESKNENRVSQGAAAREGLATIPPQYETALREGRVWRSSLEQELRDATGIGEYHERESGVTVGANRYETITEALTNHFEWSRFQTEQAEQGRRYSDESIETARKLSTLITPLMIESVFLTELMRNGDGATNMVVMDHLYRSIGPAGVATMPSLGDNIESQSGSQATHYVLGENRPVGIMASYVETTGYYAANIPDGFAPFSTIAESHDRDQNDQTIAADPAELRSLTEDRAIVVLLAMWNILYAADTPSGQQALEQIYEGAQNPETRVSSLTRLAEYIGMAHNNPEVAANALRAWWSNGGNVNVSIAQYANDDFVAEYGTKMLINFPALYERFNDRLMQARQEALPGRAITASGGYQNMPSSR